MSFWKRGALRSPLPSLLRCSSLAFPPPPLHDRRPEAFEVGAALVASFGWVQSEVSSPPHTFIHGDIKPGNMFMMGDNTPAFIDWQYTAVGKGCQDLCFMIIEGYEIDTQRALEPIVKSAYLDALEAEGVTSYEMAALERDWQLATLHFPFYVSHLTARAHRSDPLHRSCTPPLYRLLARLPDRLTA
jgi:hypothetical protein